MFQVWLPFTVPVWQQGCGICYLSCCRIIWNYIHSKPEKVKLCISRIIKQSAPVVPDSVIGRILLWYPPNMMALLSGFIALKIWTTLDIWQSHRQWEVVLFALQSVLHSSCGEWPWKGVIKVKCKVCMKHSSMCAQPAWPHLFIREDIGCSLFTLAKYLTKEIQGGKNEFLLYIQIKVWEYGSLWPEGMVTKIIQATMLGAWGHRSLGSR